MERAASKQIRVSIDGRDAVVQEGTSVLDAAASIGIRIPSVCNSRGCAPGTSCMVCVVKIHGKVALVPSCATKVIDGMVVESETAEVQSARRMAVELLLSEHVGDCVAPCVRACSAHMDIPRMIRQIKAGDFPAAANTVHEAIALPAILGRICSAPCEKVCRRGQVDVPVAICLLKRFAADDALTRGWRAGAKPSTGKKVAIIGAGPTGLAAAFHLALEGHACTVFDGQSEPGGTLLGVAEEALPRKVLQAEVDTIRQLGVEFRMKTEVGANVELSQLAGFDAVVIAAGEKSTIAAKLGLDVDSRGGIRVDPQTHRASKENVFAGGSAVAPTKLAIKAVADGRMIAVSVDQFLRGQPASGVITRYDSRLGKVTEDGLRELMKEANPVARAVAHGHDGFGSETAMREASRCMHCDCRKADTCRLRDSADSCFAQGELPKKGNEMTRVIDKTGVVYEPGKCIRCGICVEASSGSKTSPGLAFRGRGSDARICTPFDVSLGEALGQAAGKCVEACPTGALAWAEEKK